MTFTSLLRIYSQWLSSKEFTCNAGDPSAIPGLGTSPGEGIGYPFQYSWASLVAQLIKNPLAMQETWVQFLGWEDPLEKGKATHSSILAWRIPWTIKSWTRLTDFHFYTQQRWGEVCCFIFYFFPSCSACGILVP